MGLGVLKGCESLQNITLPFTGKSADAVDYEGVFGYIFDYTTQQNEEYRVQGTDFINQQVGTVDGATWQYSCYNGGVANDWNNWYYLQSYFFNIPKKLTKVVVTNETNVKIAAFNGCGNITEIVYEKTLKNINEAAFQNCKKLSRFNAMDDNVLNLEGETLTVHKKAFLNCATIEYISFDSNLTKIEESAFANCVSVKELYLPAYLEEIGDYAFQNMGLVTVLNVPKTVESIGKGAFQGWNKLREITLPFTGKAVDATAYEGVLGYIFGFDTTQSSDYGEASTAFINQQVGEVENAVWQYSCYNGDVCDSWHNLLYLQSYFYYIPKTLKSVTITNETTVKVAAFNGCTALETIVYEKEVIFEENCAFQNCSATVQKGEENN